MSDRLTNYILGTDGVDNPKSQFRDEPLRIGSSLYERALIAAKWEKVLVAEGFGYVNTKDRKVDVSAEIDNMFQFRKLMCFKSSDPVDIKLRKIQLCEYIKPYYSNKSLNRSLIVSDSFVNDIIDSIAVLYASEPKRFVPDQPEINQFISDVSESSNINTKLLEAHKLLRLVNTIGIKIVRRNRDDESVIDLDVYDPTQFRALYDNDNQLIKVCYAGEIYHEMGMREEVVYVYTADQHYYVDVDGNRHALAGNQDAVNPYGVIPFLVVQLRDADLFGGYDADLIQRNLNHNFYKLLTNDDACISTRHLTFLENIQLPDNAVISNQDVFVSESRSEQEKSSANIISGEMHFQQLKELFKDEYVQAALERGIPAFYIQNNFRELNSAKALIVQMKKLIDQIHRDIPTFRALEKRLWRIIAVVAGVESKAKRYTMNQSIDPELMKQINVDYVDMLQDMNDTDAMVQWTLQKQQVQSNVLSVLDMIRFYNRDVNTTEEARELLKQNMEDNKNFQNDGITSLFDLLDKESGGAV